MSLAVFHFSVVVPLALDEALGFKVIVNLKMVVEDGDEVGGGWRGGGRGWRGGKPTNES